MLVACEDGSSFFEKGRVKKEFIGEDLVTAAVLHRGLISGYPAPRRSVCRDKEIDKATLVGGYCSCFCSSSIGGFPDTPPEEPAVHLIVRLIQVHRDRDSTRRRRVTTRRCPRFGAAPSSSWRWPRCRPRKLSSGRIAQRPIESRTRSGITQCGSLFKTFRSDGSELDEDRVAALLLSHLIAPAGA